MESERNATNDLAGAAWFARELGHENGGTNRLQRGVELAVELIRGCEHAGVTILDKTGAHTDAATSDLVWRGDQLQYDLSEGPCLEAADIHGTVVSNNVARDLRWPQWGPRVAAELGVGSIISLLLYVDQPGATTDRQERIGALNLYGTETWSYDADDLAAAQALAAHLAVAFVAGREIEQRGTAMVNRTVIGQAEGILMERYKISADRAFEVLRRLSQNSNRKLSAIADELVRTGRLPEQATAEQEQLR